MNRSLFWTILTILPLLFGCKQTESTTGDLARQTFEAIRSGDEKAFSQLLVSKSEYRYLVSQMKRSREYHDFSPEQKKAFLRQTLDIARKYKVTQAKTLERFRNAQSHGTTDLHIDWSKVQYDTLRTYEGSMFMGIPRYDEFQVLFHADSTSFCLQIDGIIQVNKSWKLVANKLVIVPSL
jgi:hypothetical protein